MNTSRATLSCFFALAVVVALAGDKGSGAKPKDEVSDDTRLIDLVVGLDELHLVTKAPHEMTDLTALLCRDDGRRKRPHEVHSEYIKPAFCNVYVNDFAKKPMLSGQGKYPVDSLIVKSKLRSKDAKEIELLTVMRKRAEGYDPKNGNWEYSVVDGASGRVLSRGRIDSCAACHAEYIKTDFVTREYLNDKGEKDDKKR